MMRAFARALLVMVAACGPNGATHEKSDPIGASGMPHRATPAPHIAWKDNAFGTEALPVVARAGELTIVAVRQIDGERGFPNLRIEVRDRADKTIQTIPILNANEYETLAPGGIANAALQQRIEAANTELTRLHDLHDLVAMTPLEIQAPTDSTFPHLAIGDGLDVDWSGDHIHVFRHNSDRQVVTIDGKAWLAPVRANCSNPAFLRSVFHAPELTVVVVQLAYRGSDSCGVPSDQFHVVSW
ncbi:hypothetical protein BH11MYX1_BH11MYX1_57690 [soil metagenome]